MKPGMKLRSLTIAAVLATATAAPAFAMGPHARSEAVQQRQHEARTYQYYRNDRFWPGEMGASIVGGAIGTAGAVVGAPLGYDPYYDRAYGW